VTRTSLRTTSGRLAAIARRDLVIQLSYHFQLAGFFLGTFLAAVMAFYVSELIDAPAPLDPYRGSYFDYVLVGLAITAYAGTGVSAFTTQIAQEQASGTLEVLLAGPSRLAVILGGGFVLPFALATVEVGLLLTVGIGVFGAGLSADGLLLAVPIVLLILANFAALGILAAAVLLLVKRGDPVSRPLFQITLLLSGAIIPVDLFPGWLQFICHLNPAFYGVRSMREVLLGDPSWGRIAGDLSIMAGCAIVALPIAVAVFGRSVKAAKRLGVLATY
jgi:ABC-2 type transport system permease protein